ncbi:MAG: hypothetical protein HRT69_18915, partial [Flavobacteriaceae bacterium]|nr:hypothetical protein [Flavobacteriaceae bacterium]
DAKLLQKIEELTLYTISQEKQIHSLSMDNKFQAQQMTSLEERVKQLESKDR